MAGALDRAGIIVAFDSSGDLTFQAGMVALVVNLAAWFATAWFVMTSVSRRRAKTAHA